VAMENLLDQMGAASLKQSHPEIALPPVEPGHIAVVTVAPGAGIARVFASLGVAAIVEGGQTMNPSTLEILNAFKDLPTDKIVILPNNKNIILAAQTAAQAAAQSNIQKSVVVIPSRTVPQGLAAMLRLIPDGEMDAVVAEMNNALSDVETGEITTATRSVEIDGVAVQEGQFIALHNGTLILGASSVEEAVLGFLQAARAAERELITLFSGANITRAEVEQIIGAIQQAYPEQEIELQDGEQPHYHFIVSIE